MSELAIQDVLKGLQLEELDRDFFLGHPGDGTGRLFGGMVAAQSVMAAQLTVEEGDLHSLHAYFLRGGAYEQRAEAGQETPSRRTASQVACA